MILHILRKNNRKMFFANSFFKYKNITFSDLKTNLNSNENNQIFNYVNIHDILFICSILFNTYSIPLEIKFFAHKASHSMRNKKSKVF